MKKTVNNKYIIPSGTEICFRGEQKSGVFKDSFGRELHNSFMFQFKVIDKELVFNDSDIKEVKRHDVVIYGGYYWYNSTLEVWEKVPEYCYYPKEQAVYYSFYLEGQKLEYITISKDKLKIINE